MPEPRSRGASNSNSRGTRGGADRAGRSSSVQSGSSGTGKIFSPKVCIHELLNLVTKFLVFHFNTTRLYGFKIIDIGACCGSIQFNSEANSSKVTNIQELEVSGRSGCFICITDS